MRRKRLARLLWKLRAMRRSLPARDALLLRLGAARKEAGHAFRFVHIQLPQTTAAVTRESFRFRLDKTMLQQAEQRDGHYLLRSNLTAEDPAVLWTRYVQLTQIEAAFRTLKSELGIRPIYHRLEHRIDAHILMAFLAYCPQVTPQEPTAGSCPWSDAPRGPGKTATDPDDRCVDTHPRRTPAPATRSRNKRPNSFSISLSSATHSPSGLRHSSAAAELQK
jgi:hypothetical protein